MNYFDKIAAWLNPIKKLLPDTSYEVAAIDATFEYVKELEAKLLEAERSRDFGVKFFKDKCDKLLMSGVREAELKCIAEKKLGIAVEALNYTQRTDVKIGHTELIEDGIWRDMPDKIMMRNRCKQALATINGEVV